MLYKNAKLADFLVCYGKTGIAHIFGFIAVHVKLINVNGFDINHEMLLCNFCLILGVLQWWSLSIHKRPTHLT